VAVLVGHRFAAESVFGKTGIVIWKMAPWLIGCLVLLLTFEMIYYYGPDLHNRKWHWITPGTIAGIALLILVSLGLRVYLRYAGTYTLTYGSLGGVIILLLSFYLSGIALLSGGVLNAILEELTSQATCPRYQGTLDKHPPSR
jgi:membrane protein